MQLKNERSKKERKKGVIEKTAARTSGESLPFAFGPLSLSFPFLPAEAGLTQGFSNFERKLDIIIVVKNFLSFVTGPRITSRIGGFRAWRSFLSGNFSVIVYNASMKKWDTANGLLV